MSISFDYDKAKAALASNPVASAYLDANKDKLIALSEQTIFALVNAYLGGQDGQVVTTFYNLDQAANAIVTNTADIAQRQYDFKQRALTCAKIVAQLLISVLAAGVVL